MAIANSAPRVETDQGTIYVFEDERLFAALAAATGRALEQYDDHALLSQRQTLLVAKVKRAVQHELQREMPERLTAWSPWHFSRALGAYITRQIRKHQGLAFERRLVADYGPLQPLDAAELDRRTTTINGIRVIAVDPQQVIDVEASRG